MAGTNDDAARRASADQARPAADDVAVEPDTEAGSGTLQSQLEEEKARADKNLANWQRAEADLANFRRRTEQERVDLVKFANAELIRKILPAIDDLERAINTVPAEIQSDGWVEGIRLIDKKIRNVLEQEGVAVIEALGREFDPHVHEAVMREEGEGDADTVVQEFQRGYRLNDRVLRPAMVKVGRRNSSEQTTNSSSKE